MEPCTGDCDSQRYPPFPYGPGAENLFSTVVSPPPSQPCLLLFRVFFFRLFSGTWFGFAPAAPLSKFFSLLVFRFPLSGNISLARATSGWPAGPYRHIPCPRLRGLLWCVETAAFFFCCILLSAVRVFSYFSGVYPRTFLTFIYPAGNGSCACCLATRELVYLRSPAASPLGRVIVRSLIPLCPSTAHICGEQSKDKPKVTYIDRALKTLLGV